MRIFLSNIFIISLLAVGPLFGQLKMSAPFTDHMVLQRGQEVPVWGQGEPEQSVEVLFAGQKKTTSVDKNGKWSLKLDPLEGSKQGSVLEVQSGASKIEFKDVVVGEVWICSGQSNMQFPRKNVPELKGLDSAGIRTFEVRKTVAFEEQDEMAGQWQVEGPSSAVAFGFAHHLAKHVDQEFPIGIMLSCWGSSSIEAWMPRDLGKELPHFKQVMAEFDANKENQKKIQAILDKGQWSGGDDVFLRRQSNVVYNAMMAPLAPYACRGLIWYQGERNARYMKGMPKDPWFHRVGSISDYDEALKAWIPRYRREWGNDEMHFMLVMLPGFGSVLGSSPTKDQLHPAAHTWAWMRESQMAALELPNVSIANTIDLGDIKNIHPKDKAPIGERLALLAARNTLGKSIEASGPVFKQLKVRGDRVLVDFLHADGLRTTDGAAPTGFWLADKKGKWFRAVAEIKGDQVALHAEGCSQPMHVRYAFAGKPEVNLVNNAGLPAYPFRTDSGLE